MGEGEGEDGAALYHPERVASALRRLRALGDVDEVIATSRIPYGSEGYVPSEAIVRLVRDRARHNDDGPAATLRRILMERIYARIKRAYWSLGRDTVQDMAQDSAEALIRALARNTEVDWWEVSFTQQLTRAAADSYQRHKSQYRPLPHEELAEVENKAGDDGLEAGDIHRRAIFTAICRRALTADEAEFALLLSDGIPIKSAKATVDLVRLTGKGESTLRNLKTTIVRKLEALIAKEPTDGR
jgi:hypothetical protein